jgi:hypothetical protein
MIVPQSLTHLKLPQIQETLRVGDVIRIGKCRIQVLNQLEDEHLSAPSKVDGGNVSKSILDIGHPPQPSLESNGLVAARPFEMNQNLLAALQSQVAGSDSAKQRQFRKRLLHGNEIQKLKQRLEPNTSVVQGVGVDL